MGANYLDSIKENKKEVIPYLLFLHRLNLLSASGLAITVGVNQKRL